MQLIENRLNALAPSLGFNVDTAKLVIAALTFSIQAVELLAQPGSAKKEAVKQDISDFFNELGIGQHFAEAWKILGPAVDLIVRVYNLRKLWP